MGFDDKSDDKVLVASPVTIGVAIRRSESGVRGCWAGTRTRDLMVMSHSSCHCLASIRCLLAAGFQPHSSEPDYEGMLYFLLLR